MSLLFVYGTLKRGQANHALLGRSPLLGEWLTAPKYTLYDLGSYPAVTLEGTTAIYGEVYKVSEKILLRIDRLEEYPLWYDRQLIPTRWGESWIYLMPSCCGVILGSGCWPPAGSSPLPFVPNRGCHPNG
jgi:gamma-glutamylaminecyclotransferase